VRRTPVVLGATAAGLAALFTFHSRSGLAAAPTSHTSATTAPGGSSTTTTTPGGTTTTSPGSSSTTAPSGSTTSTTTAPATHTVTGKLETYGYGQLKVRATMTGGKLTDVKVVTLQTAETYSQQLANQVIPMLRSQALKAQSAKIHGISGATYTSEAFAYSLQAALSQLG
jgi:uncharacterized protein with FMN-binding domain